ncbi:hypothetical protein TRICI_005172 [Trichomonascus ciferrii]|uniref:C2H2-type domain-containing protein n=1 Tax=Trichomonascus ciferrii TaxID=44093 RepID=A0A642UVB9_9ASCO|nr:hypothetical protein TRICI_005172 [Trichomonascus ciferrii]
MGQFRKRSVNTIPHTTAQAKRLGPKDGDSAVKLIAQKATTDQAGHRSEPLISPLLRATGDADWMLEASSPLTDEAHSNSESESSKENDHVVSGPEPRLACEKSIQCRLRPDSLIKINPNRINSSTLFKMHGHVYRVALDFCQPNAMVVYRNQSVGQSEDEECHGADSDEMSEQDEDEDDDEPPVLRAKQGSLFSQLLSDMDIWQQASKAKKGDYVCSHCRRRFKTLWRLARHLDREKIHRPHRCHEPKCVWKVIGFSKPTELRRHEKTQHNKTMYQCQVKDCLKCFTRKDSLMRHIARLHHDTN